jgi:hypothetical protein
MEESLGIEEHFLVRHIHLPAPIGTRAVFSLSTIKLDTLRLQGIVQGKKLLVI